MHDLFDNALSQMRHLLTELHLQGATVIDATAGNGKDTLFLAENVGSEGKVYAFDIQQQALDNTQALLAEHGIHWYTLIKDSHENLHKYDIKDVSAVVFNLGFLPGGNHELITQPQSTLAAIKNSLELLKLGGLLTIAVYPGHEGGKAEEETILEYLSDLPRTYDVLQLTFKNRSKHPPYLITVRKQKEV